MRSVKRPPKTAVGSQSTPFGFKCTLQFELNLLTAATLRPFPGVQTKKQHLYNHCCRYELALFLGPSQLFVAYSTEKRFFILTQGESLGMKLGLSQKDVKSPLE